MCDSRSKLIIKNTNQQQITRNTQVQTALNKLRVWFATQVQTNKQTDYHATYTYTFPSHKSISQINRVQGITQFDSMRNQQQYSRRGILIKLSNNIYFIYSDTSPFQIAFIHQHTISTQLSQEYQHSFPHPSNNNFLQHSSATVSHTTTATLPFTHLYSPSSLSHQKKTSTHFGLIQLLADILKQNINERVIFCPIPLCVSSS